jgi:hypothetical protein
VCKQKQTPQKGRNKVCHFYLPKKVDELIDLMEVPLNELHNPPNQLHNQPNQPHDQEINHQHPA